jgi:hypothetical protein
VQLLPVGLAQGECNAFVYILGLGGRLDDYGRLLFGFAPEDAVKCNHSAGEHRANSAVALGGATHHVRIVGQRRLDRYWCHVVV